MIQRSLPILEQAGVPPAAPDGALRAGALRDSHGRMIRDLRISVTDRCNYRCVYCMDPDVRYMPKMSLLTREEYVRVARLCVDMGVRKLRITGGEPTLYPELDALIGSLGGLAVDEIAMTTNGSLMDAARTKDWARLGLTRLTFSLDSLRPERVRSITRAKPGSDSVSDAIGMARDAGLEPIKVNCVAMRGVNDDEFADFAGFAREHGVHVRFIEFMPLDSGRAWSRGDVVTAEEILARIGERYALEPAGGERSDSTSMNYRFGDGSPGTVGVIAPVSRAFCGACSRLRLTADGGIRPCLFSEREWNLRTLLREGADDDAVRRFIVDATWTKQAGHAIADPGFTQPGRTMSAIGG